MRRNEDKAKERSSEELRKSLQGNADLDPFEVRLRQAEQAPLESKEGYQFLVDHSKEIILVLNKKGKIIFANKNTLKDFGYSKEELIGKSIAHFLTGGSLTKALFALAQEFLGRPQPELEVQAKTKSGDIRYLSIAEGSAPIHENGKFIGVMISANDLTERKRAEKERQEAEKRFRDLWEHAPVAYHTVDTKGIITNANQTEANMLGYAKEELVGKSIFEFILLEQRAEAAARFQQKIVGHRITRAGNRVFVKKDGSKINVAIDDSLERDGDGRIIGIRTTMVDITDRKLAEENLRKRSAQLELVHHIQSEIPLNGDIETVPSQTAESIGKTFGYYKISVNLYDRATNEIEYLTGWNKTGLPLPRGHRQKLGQGLIGMAGLSKRSILANDVSKEPDYIPYHLTETKSELAIPLLVQDHLIGVLDLQATEVDAFFREDIAVLESVASYIAFIIDRKKREEALQESEEKFRLLFSEALDGICLADAETGLIIDCNNTLAAMVGRDRAELIGQHQAVLHPLTGDKAVFSSTFRQHLADKAGQVLETKIVTKTGEIREVEIKANLMNLRGRKMLQGIFRDIADRKRAEEALRKSEVQLKDAQALSRIGSWEFDLDKQTIEWSDQVYRLYERDPAMGPPNVKEEAAYYSHKQAERLREYARIAVEQGRAFEYDLEARLPSGRVAHFASTLRPTKDENGRIVKLFGTVQDITERKNAEQALKESEEKYRTLTEHVNVGVYRNTAGPQGRFLEANPAIIEMFGYESKKKFMAENVSDLYQNAEDRKEFNDKMTRNGYARNAELLLKKKDGKPFIGSISTVAVKDEQGNVKYFDGIIEDITGRKQAENELRQASNKIRQALGSIVKVVTATVEMKDPYTAGHQRRVADLARAIATEMRLSKDQIEGIRIAGTIHDLGKLFIPGEILCKPGKLNEYEFSLIRLHCQVGFDILKDIEFPWPIAQIVHQHHERMDGSGYPQGLKGEQILIEARILGVADVVEAMSSHRPYRPALGIDKALEEISREKGILYDPAVVDTCLKICSDHKFKF